MGKLLIVLGILAAGAMLFVPPIPQDPAYHELAGNRPVLGIPNFWNVISNGAFLIAAIPGVKALRRRSSFDREGEYRAYALFVAAVIGVSFGSGYYHGHPNNATLFWDRLPMTIAFMALLAMVIGERLGAVCGRTLLIPLVVAGVASVVYWRVTDDLRWYGLVQFYPAVAIVLLLLFTRPKRAGSNRAMAGLVAGYGLAKLLEHFDRQIGSVVSTGGHPWKHVAAAAGIWWFLRFYTR